MHQYKNYPIHVSAIARHAGTRAGWEALGFIFDPETSTREIKRLQTGDFLFLSTKEEARDFALLMCQVWIDGLKE